MTSNRGEERAITTEPTDTQRTVRNSSTHSNATVSMDGPAF